MDVPRLAYKCRMYSDYGLVCFIRTTKNELLVEGAEASFLVKSKKQARRYGVC